jgi:hypothetical protein
MLQLNIELSWGLISSEVRNMVSGLQDGYLYNDLLDIEFLKSEGLSDNKIADIMMLTTQIQAALKVELKWANKNNLK